MPAAGEHRFTWPRIPSSNVVCFLSTSALHGQATAKQGNLWCGPHTVSDDALSPWEEAGGLLVTRGSAQRQR